jgi:multidrug resistance protein, MATE family
MFPIKICEIKSLTRLALPLMATFLAQKGMQLIDTIMMGWIGPYALAAGALGTTIFMTVMLFCMGTLSAVGVFIARAKGAKQDADIRSHIQHGILLALILSVPGMIIIWLVPHVLPIVGEDLLIVKNTALLLHGLVWGLPGFLLFLVLREFISAFALTRIVMLVTLCSLPITFIANYVLIYGKYGFPQLGIAGIGYAGAVVMWFMFICLLLYSKKNILLKNYVCSLTKFIFESRKIITMFSMGVPSGAILVFDVGMFLIAVIIVSHFGVNALAAYQVAMQCAMLVYASPFALSMAVALQVSHAAGANDLAQVKRFTGLTLGLGLMIAVAIALLFLLAPQFLAELFLTSHAQSYKEIIKLAGSFLAIAALFQCFDAIQAILIGTLKGLQDTFVPMLMIAVCYWLLGVGGSYYFAFQTHLAAAGVWYGLTLGIGSGAMTLIARYFFVLRNKFSIPRLKTV